MDPERQFRSVEESEESGSLRILIGAILIVIGCIILLWTFMQAYKIFTNPKEIEIFKQIVPVGTEAKEITFKGNKIELSEGIYIFMAYGVCLFLLFITVTIGSCFMSGGVNLIQANLKTLRYKFQRLYEKLNKSVKALKQGGKGPTDYNRFK